MVQKLLYAKKKKMNVLRYKKRPDTIKSQTSINHQMDRKRYVCSKML